MGCTAADTLSSPLSLFFVAGFNLHGALTPESTDAGVKSIIRLGYICYFRIVIQIYLYFFLLPFNSILVPYINSPSRLGINQARLRRAVLGEINLRRGPHNS